MISQNFDDRWINLAYPRILASENRRKYNIHLGEVMKSDDFEDFMKATEK